MKKTTLRQVAMHLALLLFVVLAPLGLRAQETLTVNDGTATNGYVPVYGYYCDNYSRSQFIIPATALTDMQWGSITKLTFYSSNSSQNWGNASFKVYFTETDATTLSALADWNTLSEAYSGSLSISDNKMEVTLTTPYQYTGGGNLLIGINQNVSGDYRSASFYGVSATGASMGGYGASVSQQNFLPKTTFEFTPGEAPSCLPATALSATNVEAHQAQLAWTANNGENSWNIYYKKVSETEYTEVTGVTTNPYTLTGLDDATQYQFYVVAVCNANDQSDPSSTGSFTTECDEITSFPWSVDFETMTNNTVPNCWDNSASSSSDINSNPNYIWGVYEYGGNKMLRMYNYYVHSGTAVINTPHISIPAGADYQLTFNYSHLANCGAFTLKVSTDGGATFADLKQYQATSTSYNYTNPGQFTEDIVSLADYAGQTIMLQLFSNANYGQGAIFIDDITIAPTPTCYKPTATTVGAYDQTTATLSWTADQRNQEGGSYSIVWVTDDAGDMVLDANSTPAAVVNGTSATLSGLTENTAYSFKVRTNCAEQETVEDVVFEPFTTLANCVIPQLAENGITVTAHSADVAWTDHVEGDNYTVSYREAAFFDGITEEFGTAIPTGWENKSGLLTTVMDGGALSNGSAWNFGSSNGVFNNHARINIYGTSMKGWLITPSTEVGTGFVLNFDVALTAYSGTVAAPSTTGTDDRFVVLITTDDMATWSILREWNNNGSVYVYNDIACSATGENVAIDLSAYAGQTVRVAFYGESTVSNADNNLHIDNVGIGQMVDATDWVNINNATKPQNISNLQQTKAYEVKVIHNCTSATQESATLSFTTLPGNEAPTLSEVTGITTTTATVNWTLAPGNTLHAATELFVVRTDTATALPATIAATTTGFIGINDAAATSYQLAGLTAGKTYKVWARVYCGQDGTSQWAGPVTFATACEAITANGYVENFDNYTAGNNVLPICWNYINTTTYNPNSIYPKLYSYSFTSSPNSLGLLSSYSSSSDYDPQPQYAILPEMNGLGGMRLTLMARGYNTSSTFKVGTMSNPADATTFNEVAEQTDLTTSYQTFTFDIPTNTTDRYLAIMIDAANSDRNSNGIYIDNLSITPTPSCEMPTGLSLMDETLSYDQAQITFEPSVSGESNWDLYWSTSAEAPTDGTVPTATVDSDQPLLTGLAVQTAYYVWVRARCSDNEFSAWVGPLQFTTTAVPTVVGDAWNDDFEGNSCDWDLINGNLTNAWAWGSETNNGGNNALYVSNDGGTTYEYTNNSSTMVYAAKLLTFAQSKYIFEYDWNGNGESTYDYLRVALVPASESLTAGTSLPTGFNYYTLPTGWIALDGGSKLNLATSWQNKSVAVNVPAAGNYYLVLAWRNDSGGGSNPPAAVDNVSVTRVTCPYDVDDLTVDDASITTTSASVSWTAGEASEWQVAFKNANDDDWTILPSTCTSTSATLTGLTPSSVYMVRARVYCNADDQGVWCDPETFATACEAIAANGYTEDFDNYTAGNNVLPNCWNYINTCTNSSYNIYPRIYNYSSNSTPNNLQLYSYYSSWSSSSDPQPQYAILPEMDDLSGMRLTLMAKGYNANSTFKVGTMSDPADASTFNEVAEQTGLSTYSYQTFTFDIPEGTADRHLVIMIDAANTNRSTNAVYIDDISIAPTPSCLEPTGLQLLAVETNDAQITWTAGGSEQLWDLYWSTSNEAPSAETTPTVSGTNNQQPWMNGSLQPATTYYAWVRAHCFGEDRSAWTGPVTFTTECEAFSIPFIEDFENGINCWSLVDCASSTGVQSNFSVSGTKSFKFNYNTNPPQYLISPEFSGVEEGTLVSFMYRVGGSYTESFALGYSTTTAEVEAFTWFDEQIDLTNTSYQKYSETLPAGVKYLAVKYTANDQLSLYIDDFKVFVPTTVQKEVQANKWYAIATPIADPAVADVQNLTDAAAYDLYAWDEFNGRWSAPASLTAGKGYIYRRAEATTLSFTGEVNTGNFDIDVTASCPDNDLKGFNLVGNPYNFAISRDNVYQLDMNGSWNVVENAIINEAEGFMVYTNASGTEAFTETPVAKGAPTVTESLMFTLKNGTFKDVAYARFGSQSAMPKLGHLNAAAPVLSIPVDGRSYAIAQLADDCEQFDLAFRGAEGDYTISLGNATTAFAYIHLIDRLTGRDIDLLRQPSYSFSHSGLGSTANRFAVMLRPAAGTASSDAFARWNGTNWEVEGSGKLQVFDVVGRPLFGTEVDGQTTIDNAVFPAAGVYIIRLGDKTQKIVVK